MSDNIKVVVKVRPLISREIDEKLSYQWRITNNTLAQIDQNGRDLGQSYTFDKVYDEDTKTSDVYNDVAKPIVEAATAGFNGTIFAYGQTSSGKTYTMTGTESSPGIIPLAVVNLFDIIENIPDRDFLVRVSYIEIYNETVRDLLNVEKDNIKIHETLQGIKVDVAEKVTSSPEEVLETMREGEANRQKGATNMNEESSRSHSIFQITIESREHIEGETQGGCVNVSQLNLVDLAGSERAGQTGATGKRFKEGTHINKSLSALALVIKQLSEENKFTNYRDSKLTRILQNSLGGNAKTSIICAVTPAAAEETISTLQFANRAKAIKNKPEVNAVATDATMIQKLTKQMSSLKAQLESKKNLEQDNYNLQKQISALQKLILNGFGQPRSVDMIGGRQLQQQRRVTIHGTVSTKEDEPVVNVPKFCTPTLKYNPLVIATSDFAPIQSANKLASVPEEPARLITPPPQKAVCFSGDVIVLDSDDESVRDDQETCSPIHKCFGSLKTPPCILRKNAKRAEKDLKEIVELTEREKIFSPSAVELMEKLEENASTIIKLKDDIEVLNKRSEEKDTQIDELSNKIKTIEEESKAITTSKLDLQTQCDLLNRKLTDWEVSYETLKNKAQLREKELLSLLDERKDKTAKDIDNILSQTLEKEIHFMDMIKDVSPVNSDNENNVSNSEDTTENIDALVKDAQEQLSAKNQHILEMESIVFSQKQKIESLESLTTALEQTVTTLKEKIGNIESENSLLKATIDSLNTTLNNQKESLESAHKDMESYNSLIQELQIKLRHKEDLLKTNIDDSILDSMIANEEQFIANNENMKNIIISFKRALQAKNKEITSINKKCTQNIDLASINENLSIQLQNKTEELEKLNHDMDDLKKECCENIVTLNKLMREIKDHKLREQELSNIQHENSELQKIIRENEVSMQELKIKNDRLVVEFADKNKNLTKEIEDLTTKISNLEININHKDDIIKSLSQYKLESEENLLKARSAVVKSQSILCTLSGNMQEVPEIIDNFVNVFTVLSDSLSTLETVASDIAIEKEEINQLNFKLKTDLEQSKTKFNTQVKILQEQIKSYDSAQKDYEREKQDFIETINQLKNDLEKLQNELDKTLSLKYTLEANLDELRSADNLTNQRDLDKMLLLKDGENSSLTKKLETVNNKVKEQDIEIDDLKTKFNKSHLDNVALLTHIHNKVVDITNSFHNENHLGKDIFDKVRLNDEINIALDKISKHITLVNIKNAEGDNNNIDVMLTEAKRQIEELTNKNRNLVEKIFDVEKQNSELLVKIETNENNSKQLTNDLTDSQHLLQDLQTELNSKVLEMECMEQKLKKWKGEFENLDVIMKEQMNEMKIENENLKARIKDADSEISLNLQDSRYKCEDYNQKCNNKILDKTTADVISPPSLLTICCNRIVEFIDPKDTDKPIDSSIDVAKQSPSSNCLCSQFTSELIAAREENSRILDLLAEMEIINKNLLEEQEVYRSEIQLLLQLVQELQKKILNHKTNLSILTATTYTENKLLQSQVKVLLHHNKRFHNVCQRDIGEFKKQLHTLMLVLKRDVSLYDQQNASFKRFSLPDVLSNRPAQPNFKNESTLDGDLLMLDTNITLTTVADSTLTGNDQTCMDMSQYEAFCESEDLDQIRQQLLQQINLMPETENSVQQIVKLKGEITALCEQLRNQPEKPPTVDAQNSPIKKEKATSDNSQKDKPYECVSCKELNLIKDSKDKVTLELNIVTEELENIKSQKIDLEQKYKNLVLETPSTDALIKRLNVFEKDFSRQKQEIANLHNTINNKNKELSRLQEENNSLSNEVMDNISEIDNLNKELDCLKLKNVEQKGFENRTKQDDLMCSKCIIKDELIQTLQSKAATTHSKLNRSLSDSDTSSRCNKICTLQSELHAGREDCKVLTEDVVTIKNHLDRSNMSMDLDESMDENNIYRYSKDLEVINPQSNKCNMPDIPEECNSDIYKMDKIDCLNYYIEKTGARKNNISHDTKIIQIMKKLYEFLITEHATETENLTNKLLNFEETRKQLQNLVHKHSEICKELEVKSKKCANVDDMLLRIRNTMKITSDKLNSVSEIDHTNLVKMFKDNLSSLDNELDLSSVEIFDCLIEKVVTDNHANLLAVTENCTKLKQQLQTVTGELDSVNINLTQMKTLLSTKEKEYDLLKAQKEKVHEIANAVTLDIVKREKDLRDTIHKGYQTLVEFNIVKPEDVDSDLPLNININNLFELLVNQNKFTRINENEKAKLLLEINNMQTMISHKEKEIDLLKTQCINLKELNNGVTLNLQSKENKIRELLFLQDELNKTYDLEVKENKANKFMIEQLSKDVNTLKDDITNKENIIKRLEQDLLAESQSKANEVKIIDLLENAKRLQEEINNLKSINAMISKERECYAEELKKSGETIKKNNIDLEKMTSDILILRKSVKDNGDVIENLSTEAKSLLTQNKELREQLETKSRECSRLETNIKTHEKTAQIQTKIISRLEKQKDEEAKLHSETKQKLEEITQKYLILEKHSVTSKTEMEEIKQTNELLKARITELEATLEVEKGCSVDAKADSSRRRRQSLQDSMRIIAAHKNDDDHGSIEAVFSSRPKSDDLFMDVDDQSSSRSTPIRLSRGRDSLSLSRTDQRRLSQDTNRALHKIMEGKVTSDKDDEHPSRPSSVRDTRRRRQTIHDSHRSELSKTAEHDGESTVSQLKDQLASCQQELEELKEKYRELDLECETCAEYYRERDEQCGNLVMEKRALQMTIKELEEKLQTSSPNRSQINTSKPKVVDASVNTDKDWANLHSVVVDRMSYDAEVEKNKKLTKSIEELRFKQQDLKNIISKMQKALDKNGGTRELETTKSDLKKCKEELQKCKEELAQLKESYKELNEECEICAQYLREREDQCYKLKEAKAALEVKLQEFQSDHNPMTQSTRKKRQTAHDQNRTPTIDEVEAATQTTDDLLSYQVERDCSSRRSTDDKKANEVKYLKLAMDRLLKQKEALEQQLKLSTISVPQPAMLVATGSAIVQNQQITDIMKENQKLKKMNAKLIDICKKRGKDSNRENEDPANNN